jgi:perosamine synthetase
MQMTRLRSLAGERSKQLENSRSGRPGTLRVAVQRLAGAAVLPLTVTTSTERAESWATVTRYSVAHAHRSEMRVTVLTPTSTGAGPLPAVVVFAGLKATLERVTGEVAPDFPDRNVAERLCRAGFVTVTMDYGLGADPATEAAALSDFFDLAGGSLLGALAEDGLSVLAWARELPQVDAARTGLFGHSLGAAVALHTALLAGEPLPVCTASHLGTYAALYGARRTGPTGGYLPGILRHGDLPDLYAALAPAPLEVQYGLRDRLLDPADAASAERSITSAYRAAGAADRLRVRALDLGHGTDVAGAAEFFATHLAVARPDEAPVPAGRVLIDVASRREILDRVDNALATGALTLGPFGRQLEELATPWTGSPAAAVSSGSSALEIALRICAVQGRRVLVQSNTFFATAASAVRAGARVSFVDTELDGLGMEPEHLRTLLDRHEDVAAVVPVHIAGVVSPGLEQIRRLCEQRGVDLVEDAAHALGATLDGRPAGSFGRFGAFSLYPTKVATSGEGGLLSCARPDDLTAVQRYRDQGKASFTANVHDVLGSNWRMSELHAAVGIAQLQRLPGLLAVRRRLAAVYDDGLAGLSRARIHRPPARSASNYYKYVVLLEPGVDREALRERLRQEHGVALSGGIYDVPVPAQPYFGDAMDPASLPGTVLFTSRHICLPLFPGLTEVQQARVVTAIRAELG